MRSIKQYHVATMVLAASTALSCAASRSAGDPPPGPLYSNPPLEQRAAPSLRSNRDSIFLTEFAGAPPATSIEESTSRFSARAAASVFAASGGDLAGKAGADYGVALLAKWA